MKTKIAFLIPLLLLIGCELEPNYASSVDADLIVECHQAGGTPIIKRNFGEGPKGYVERYGGCIQP